MRAIEKKFLELKRKNQGALIAYVCGGDPYPEYTSRIVQALIQGGADMIEIGVPFSDPIADGPTIQAASVRALKAKTTPYTVLDIIGQIKENTSIPIIVLTYYNPIYRMGLPRFFKAASDRGVDGVIIPDLPFEEATDYKEIADNYEVDTIFLTTPNTSKQRLEKIISYSSGFLYLVSVFGVTGARESVKELTLKTIQRLKPFIAERLPIAVGFGVSEPKHVETIIKSGAEGVIVGSALVKIIEQHLDSPPKMIEELKDKTRKLKAATS